MALDSEACPLASLEVQYRLIQARVTAEFLGRRLWRPLGFARLADYAAEPLGTGARTLEEDARVPTALEVLPVLEQAFKAGAIRWTHVRMLAGIATPQTEQGWLRLALTSATRGLAELLKGVRSGDAAPGDGAPVDAPGRAAEGTSPDACAFCGTAATGDAESHHALGGPGPDACASCGAVFDDDAATREVPDCGSPDACASRDTMAAGQAAAAWAPGGASPDACAFRGTMSASDMATSEVPDCGSPDACASCGAVFGGDAAADRAPKAPSPNACASDDTAAAGDVHATHTANAATDAEDPPTRWSIVTTRSCRQLWHVVVDLAARMSGADVSPAHVAEAVAAEAMSSPFCDPPSPPSPPGRPPAHRRADAAVRTFEAATGTSEGYRWGDRNKAGPARVPEAIAAGKERLECTRALSWPSPGFDIASLRLRLPDRRRRQRADLQPHRDRGRRCLRRYIATALPRPRQGIPDRSPGHRRDSADDRDSAETPKEIRRTSANVPMTRSGFTAPPAPIRAALVLLLAAATPCFALPATPPPGAPGTELVETTFDSVDAVVSAQWEFPARTPAPLVVILPASDHVDRHGLPPGFGEDPAAGIYAQFARKLLDAGFAVFRFDSPGTGRSSSGRYATTRSTALEGYTRAVDHAKVDPDRVFILGHGGSTDTAVGIYPRFHAVQPPAGVILLSNVVGETDIVRATAPMLLIVTDRTPDDHFQRGRFPADARNRHKDPPLETHFVVLPGAEDTMLAPTDKGDGTKLYSIDPRAVEAILEWMRARIGLPART